MGNLIVEEVKDFLHDSFGYYVANSMDSEDISLKIEKIWGFNIDERSRELINSCLTTFGLEWENYPCNEDGATPFEENELQRIEDLCVDNILDIVLETLRS